MKTTTEERARLLELIEAIETPLPWHNHEGDWVNYNHDDIVGIGERECPNEDYAIASCNALPALLEDLKTLEAFIAEIAGGVLIEVVA